MSNTTKESKNTTITIRLSQEYKTKLEYKAKLKKVSLSSIVRNSLIEAVDN